jgi:hypothetical protein
MKLSAGGKAVSFVSTSNKAAGRGFLMFGIVAGIIEFARLNIVPRGEIAFSLSFFYSLRSI